MTAKKAFTLDGGLDNSPMIMVNGHGGGGHGHSVKGISFWTATVFIIGEVAGG